MPKLRPAGERGKARSRGAEAAVGGPLDAEREGGALRGEAAETLRAAPDTVRGIEVTADEDPQARAGRTPGLFGERQAHALAAHGVVRSDHALGFFAQDLIQVDIAEGTKAEVESAGAQVKVAL